MLAMLPPPLCLQYLSCPFPMVLGQLARLTLLDLTMNDISGDLEADVVPGQLPGSFHGSFLAVQPGAVACTGTPARAAAILLPAGS